MGRKAKSRNKRVINLIEQIRLLLNEHPDLSMYQISKILSISSTRVNWAVKLGQLNVRRIMLKPKNVKSEDIDKFQTDLKDLNKSVPELAKKYDLPKSSIAYWSKKFGVPPHSRARALRPDCEQRVETMEYLRSKDHTWDQIGNLYGLTKQGAIDFYARHGGKEYLEEPEND